MVICGIYSILNKINGKVYLGSSKDISIRFADHRYRLRHNTHTNSRLQRAWNKYGEDAFDFSIVEKCKPTDQFSLEQKYLNTAKKNRKNYYNISFDATTPGYERKIQLTKKQEKELMEYWINHTHPETCEFVRKTYGYSKWWTVMKIRYFKQITDRRPVHHLASTKNHNAKLTEQEVRIIKKFFVRNQTKGAVNFISSWFGISQPTASKIKQNLIWKTIN